MKGDTVGQNSYSFAFKVEIWFLKTFPDLKLNVGKLLNLIIRTFDRQITHTPFENHDE